MDRIVAVAILATTVGIALARPVVFRSRRIDHMGAAAIGVLLSLAAGLVSLREIGDALAFLAHPIATIVSLMVITIIAHRTGLFLNLAQRIVDLSGGSCKRLFFYLFFAGIAIGSLFTNDAVVLIFTPMVVLLVSKIQNESWHSENCIPFYFAVLYVANVGGIFVVSNPINIVVSEAFDITFFEYAGWMVLPSIASILVTYAGIRFAFRKSLPESFTPNSDLFAPAEKHETFQKISIVVLGVTLTGFFSEQITGIPTWIVASVSAVTFLVLYRLIVKAPAIPVVRAVAWDVVVFIVGIFIVTVGMRNAGLPQLVGTVITGLAEATDLNIFSVTSYVSALCASVMNNHPTAYTMAIVIEDMHLPGIETRLLVFASLIGGDLGPKMLPLGSLAALLWFRILRDNGIDIPYRLYIKIGIPVTLLAVAAADLVLGLEYAIYNSVNG